MARNGRAPRPPAGAHVERARAAAAADDDERRIPSRRVDQPPAEV